VFAGPLEGLVAHQGPIVSRGPFRVMRYPARVLDGANDAAAWHDEVPRAKSWSTDDA
jgi:hypothetical protein